MPDCPSFGEGQGKGSSPSNWLFTVSTLLAVLHQLCTGVKLFSVCRNKKAERVADAYVDDTGGRLCPKETFWWLIWWNWKDGMATMSTKEDLDMNISLKFGRDQSETTTKRRNCDEAVKDLGVLVSPEGDFSLEFLR
eukprot:5619933-Ditylum_brightwellii.AAC.1